MTKGGLLVLERDMTHNAEVNGAGTASVGLPC